jgi:hypothetical protein
MATSYRVRQGKRMLFLRRQPPPFSDPLLPVAPPRPGKPFSKRLSAKPICGTDKSASVYERVRFTWMKNRHLGQSPKNPLTAILPSSER